jgi:probable HAF family extracellular repeat protein
MYDLGTLGGTESFGGSINASGQVAGFSYTTGHAAYHAYLWTPTTPNGTSGTMQDLATLGGLNSYSYNVGAGGQVVGASEVEITSGDTHAFLYTSGSGMVDLNTLIDPLSGWQLLDAADINEAGQITGQGLIGGQYRAYLLTPIAILGDFNNDGTVDAADYVVWRKGLGTIYTQDDYNTWRANFGATAAGAAAVAHSATGPAVPEPASVALLLFAAFGLLALVVRRSPDRARSRPKVSLPPPRRVSPSSVGRPKIVAEISSPICYRRSCHRALRSLTPPAMIVPLRNADCAPGMRGLV